MFSCLPQTYLVLESTIVPRSRPKPSHIGLIKTCSYTDVLASELAEDSVSFPIHTLENPVQPGSGDARF